MTELTNAGTLTLAFDWKVTATSILRQKYKVLKRVLATRNEILSMIAPQRLAESDGAVDTISSSAARGTSCVDPIRRARGMVLARQSYGPAPHVIRLPCGINPVHVVFFVPQVRLLDCRGFSTSAYAGWYGSDNMYPSLWILGMFCMGMIRLLGVGRRLCLGVALCVHFLKNRRIV